MTTDARTRDECASDFTFDRWVAGELPGEETRALQQHLASCDACRKRGHAIEAARLAFASKAPALSPGRRSAAGKGLKQHGHPRQLWPALSAAAAVAISLTFIGTEHPGLDSPGERTKGASFDFDYRVLRSGQLLPGLSESPVYPGDRVQFLYWLKEPGYLAVVSRDGQGKVSVYYPQSIQAAYHDAGDAVPLPESTQLDGSLGPETLYGLYCSEAVSTSELRAAVAHTDGAPSLPPTCKARRLAFDKAEP